jgi:hypothetical protein
VFPVEEFPAETGKVYVCRADAVKGSAAAAGRKDSPVNGTSASLFKRISGS